ncbi:GGA1 protein, partial [Polypterus senegalus]
MAAPPEDESLESRISECDLGFGGRIAFWGIVKQDPILPDDKPLPPPPPRPKNAIFEDEEKSKMLSRLLNSTHPEDLRAANRLIKEMVQEDQKRMEKISKRVAAIKEVNNNVKILTEMLNNYNKETSTESNEEVIKELYQRCDKMRPTLFRLASDTEDNDEALAEILQANDNLTQVINMYKQVVKGEEVNGESSTTPRMSGSNSALLDLTGLDTSVSSATPFYPAVPTLSQGHIAPPTEMSLSFLDDELMSLGLNETNPTPSITTQTLDSSGWHSFQSSDGMDPTTPAAPAVVLKPAVPSNPPSTQGPSVSSKALDDLDLLGKTLLQQSLPPEAMQVKWDKQQQHAKPTLRDLQHKSNPLGTVAGPAVSNSSAPVSTSPSKPSFSGMTSSTVEQTVSQLGSLASAAQQEELSLANVNVPLESIKPSSILPVTVFDSNSFRVLFHFAQDPPPGRPDVLVVVISMISTAPLPMHNIVFQSAVPKTMKVKLQPPSGTELPAFNPIIPPTAITQVLLLANPHKEKVRLRYKLTFTMGDETYDEMGDVDQFPTPESWGTIQNGWASPARSQEDPLLGGEALSFLVSRCVLVVMAEIEEQPQVAGPVEKRAPEGEIEGEEDDDELDETLSERLWGLTEMFPDGMRNAVGVTLNCSVTVAKKLYSFTRSALWIGTTSFMILVLPVVFETEKLQLEQQQLQQQRQNMADIKKLKMVGICTIKGIQMTTRRAMGNIKGLSEAKVDKIKEAANKLIEPGFVTAFAYSEKRKMVFHISTGSQEFDKLLGGGIESMAITEAFGDRLKDIADRFNVDHDAVLDNVLYARAYTSEHQMELLDFVAAKFHEEAGIFKLLSTGCWRKLGYCWPKKKEKKSGETCPEAEVEEESKESGTEGRNFECGQHDCFQADPKKPIGGHILAHASTTRISLRKGRGEMRIAKIYDRLLLKLYEQLREFLYQKQKPSFSVPLTVKVPVSALWPQSQIICTQMENEMARQMDNMRRSVHLMNQLQHVLRNEIVDADQVPRWDGRRAPFCKVEKDGQQFSASLEVEDFKPEELTVKQVGRKVMLSGKKEKKEESDGGSYSTVIRSSDERSSFQMT